MSKINIHICFDTYKKQLVLYCSSLANLCYLIIFQLSGSSVYLSVAGNDGIFIAPLAHFNDNELGINVVYYARSQVKNDCCYTDLNKEISKLSPATNRTSFIKKMND